MACNEVLTLTTKLSHNTRTPVIQCFNPPQFMNYFKPPQKRRKMSFSIILPT